eukprot:6196846-Pleurochrysis_carterae.AAC.2
MIDRIRLRISMMWTGRMGGTVLADIPWSKLQKGDQREGTRGFRHPVCDGCARCACAGGSGGDGGDGGGDGSCSRSGDRAGPHSAPARTELLLTKLRCQQSHISTNYRRTFIQMGPEQCAATYGHCGSLSPLSLGAARVARSPGSAGPTHRARWRAPSRRAASWTSRRCCSRGRATSLNSAAARRRALSGIVDGKG